MARGIQLSKNHGVNPSVMLCFVCGEAKGVALLGKLKGDAEAPRQAVWDRELCGKCQDYMAQGVVLISVQEGEEEKANPHRTGHFVVVTDEYIQRVIATESVRKDILRQRMAFVPDSAWKMLWLPTEVNS